MTASPVLQPPNLRHFSRGFGPVALWIAPSAPPPPSRERFAMILRVSSENTFGPLKETGEDCAGAVSLFAPDKTPRDKSSPLYRELSEDDADSILSNLDSWRVNFFRNHYYSLVSNSQTLFLPRS
jgi:hypothetical protein